VPPRPPPTEPPDAEPLHEARRLLMRGLRRALRALSASPGRESADRDSPAAPLGGGPLRRRLAALIAEAVPRNRSGNNASVR
jgi:hypothetical protein